jgi:hypothetical protein
VREPYAKLRIKYELSSQPKSGIYASWLAMLNSKRCRLLDHAKLFQQIVSLERNTRRGGSDSIDHPRGLHDDLVNVAAGALLLAAKPVMRPMIGAGGPDGRIVWRDMRTGELIHPEDERPRQRVVFRAVDENGRVIRERIVS